MRTTSETVRLLVRAAGAFAVAASTAVVLAGGASAVAMGGETYGENNASTCEEADRSGETIASGQVKFTIEGKKYLTITEVGDYVITAIVVKGDTSYYTYSVSDLGELPWKRLQAPDKENGKPAEIKGWFLCGAKGSPSTTTTTTTTTTTGVTTTTTPATTTTTTSGSTTSSTSGSSTSSTPGASTSGTSSSTTSPATKSTTKTSTPVAAAGSKDDLASTGFGSMWLLFLGGGLVALGIAFVASPKLRGLLRR